MIVKDLGKRHPRREKTDFQGSETTFFSFNDLTIVGYDIICLQSLLNAQDGV